MIRAAICFVPILVVVLPLLLTIEEKVTIQSGPLSITLFQGIGYIRVARGFPPKLNNFRIEKTNWGWPPPTGVAARRSGRSKKKACA